LLKSKLMVKYYPDYFSKSNPDFPKWFSVRGLSPEMMFEKAWQTYGKGLSFSPSGAPSANSKKVWRKYGVGLWKSGDLVAYQRH